MSIIDDLNALPDTEDTAEAGPGAAFSFKDLLAEAVAHKADGEKLKALRKTTKTGLRLSEEEAADLRRMENAREWFPRASVAMFQVQHCLSCDNYGAMFTGLFQRQASRHAKGVNRWIAATESENYGLKQEVKTNEVDIPFCCFCLTEHGFPGEQLGIDFGDDVAAQESELEGSLQDTEIDENQLSLDLEESPA